MGAASAYSRVGVRPRGTVGVGWYRPRPSFGLVVSSARDWPRGHERFPRARSPCSWTPGAARNSCIAVWIAASPPASMTRPGGREMVAREVG